MITNQLYLLLPGLSIPEWCWVVVASAGSLQVLWWGEGTGYFPRRAPFLSESGFAGYFGFSGWLAEWVDGGSVVDG